MTTSEDRITHVRASLVQTHPNLILPEVILQPALVQKAPDLLKRVKLPTPFCLVTDQNLWPVIGEALSEICAPEQVIVLENPYASEAQAEALRQSINNPSTVIAVGSGTINDLCKLASFRCGTDYVVFPTAASMNGYVSATASMTLKSGLKVSLPAHMPKGVFIDVGVSAQAPAHLSASGFGDTLARSTAQVDWWISHRLLGTFYNSMPFDLTSDIEIRLFDRIDGLPDGDHEAVTLLHELLILGGIGMAVAGSSHPASMGEHLICHYMDCFAGELHPGSLHGQQVGLTSLTMARLQSDILARPQAPRLWSAKIDDNAVRERIGPDAAKDCQMMMQKKRAMFGDVDLCRERLCALWPELQRECRPMMLSPDFMREMLIRAGGCVEPQELGWEDAFYHQAVQHAREIRDRFSCLDLALLD